MSRDMDSSHDENGEKTEKLIAVELAPPFDADDEKLLESAHLLKNAGVDVPTFPDSPVRTDKSRFRPHGEQGPSGYRP